MKTYKIDVDKVNEIAFRKGMSISRLCEVAGMSRSRATEWKVSSVYPQTVYRIAQVLDVDPMDLVIKEMATEKELR